MSESQLIGEYYERSYLFLQLESVRFSDVLEKPLSEDKDIEIVDLDRVQYRMK